MLSPAEEIKGKLDIVEVISEYISMKAAGANFRANCPFHHEKTPSFMISPEKQIWHCFGCGKGGDVLGFVMEMEGLTFPETLRQLAPKAGVILRTENLPELSKRHRLLDVTEGAVEYYQRAMFKNLAVKNYLKNRGLDETTVKLWKIGYSPESWDDLILYLKAKKFTDEEIFLAGLSLKKEGSGHYFNRFRDRVMFPLNDVSGQTVGFTARLNPQNSDLNAEKQGKYINSPQTPIYDKSRLLFGLDKAKKAIKDQDAVIIVEGQMDVITCHQFGYQNTVASSGTALGPEQIKLIQRFTNNIVFAFDADAAGQLAADRGIKEALTAEMNIKIIIIPGAKDPDEAIRKNKDEWDKAVKNAEPLLEYFFNKTLSGLDLNKTADKRIATQKILDLVAKFTSKLEIDHWLKRLSAEIDIAENILWETLTKIKTKQNAKPIFKTNSVAPIVKTNSEESRLEKLSNLFLALLIKAPGLIEYALNNLDTDSLDNESLRAFYKSLIIYYNKSNDLNYANFRAYLAGSEVSYINLLDTLALLGDKDFADLDELEIKNELIKTISALKQTNFQTRLKDLERQIAMAERNKEADRVTALMGDFKTLSEQLKSLENN